jgi:hypothetical protein
MSTYKEVGRIVLRGGLNGGFADFTSIVNIPGLHLDNDEFVYLRVENISQIAVKQATVSANCAHINVICPSIPQLYSYDSGAPSGTVGTQSLTGQSVLLASVPYVWQYTFSSVLYYAYSLWTYPRIPFKLRANMLQGKAIRICLELSNGTPIPASALNPADSYTITLAVYK